MIGLVSTILASAALLAGCASGYANPGPCSGVCVDTRDPTLIRRDDGEYFRLSTGGRIAIHSAPAITGPWRYRGAALPGGSRINKPGRDDLWAPEVIKRGQEYFMYYSVSTPGSQDSAIGIATSANLETWTDHGSTGVESRLGGHLNAIDGHVFKSANPDTYLMSFGSFWGGIYTTPMRNPPRRTLGQGNTHVAHEPRTTAIEAPFIFQHGGFYYLFFSAGKCCGYDRDRPSPGEEYKIKVCRSGSAARGYVDSNGVDCICGGGTTVLESHGFVYGPGGQGVYNDPSGGPVLYYHYVDTRIGFDDGQKRFGWNRIDFSSGWPVV